MSDGLIEGCDVACWWAACCIGLFGDIMHGDDTHSSDNTHVDAHTHIHTHNATVLETAKSV